MNFCKFSGPLAAALLARGLGPRGSVDIECDGHFNAARRAAAFASAKSLLNIKQLGALAHARRLADEALGAASRAVDLESFELPSVEAADSRDAAIRRCIEAIVTAVDESIEEGADRPYLVEVLDDAWAEAQAV